MVEVPIYKQSNGFCGPSSLRMSFAYYGVMEEEGKIARLIGLNSRDGCDARSILSAASKCGFSGSFFYDEGSVNQLRRFSLEYPVIVDWMLPEFHEGHYSVAMHLDSEKIHLAEPFFGERRIMSIGDFVRLWYDYKGLHPQKKSDFILRRAIVIKR